ncbi:hypothetical protein HY382_02060 [Candidatus Curtissbacteria bacterium]|nr:hypothetical protein [Candidatus Curtissbacteria bacterium]
MELKVKMEIAAKAINLNRNKDPDNTVVGEKYFNESTEDDTATIIKITRLAEKLFLGRNTFLFFRNNNG